VHDDLEQRIYAFPRRRTYLLPALHEVHDMHGWLPPDALELIGAHLRVPKSEVFGIASSYPDFRLSEPPIESANGVAYRSVPDVEDGTLVADGECSRSVADTAHARGVHVGCPGNCWQAPAISSDGGFTWTSGALSWSRPSTDRLFGDVGRIDPYSTKPYAALEKALSLGSDPVWQLVNDSGLRGRGGAYFPVGAKWQTARNTPADRKFLLVNAEEGEPGIFKDRHLLEGDPHLIVEGVLIAALGIRATEIVIFVNGEARLSQERLLHALQSARAAGVVDLPVEVRLGAGGYVLGEETALINAIHGQRAEPLARPPFPAVSGLKASPTVINNVESLASLPGIVLNGAEWFRSVGTASTPGTKLVSLGGAVRRPGVYEVPLGVRLRSIIDDCGGGPTGELRGLLVGGPSGSILPPSLLDTPFDVHPLQAVGGVLGAGGIVPLSADRCPVAAVREQVAYNARESCGKCTPCREGTGRMLGLFDALCGGRAAVDMLHQINDLNDILSYASLCGLGQMAPNPVRTLLKHFPDDVREHLAGRCAAGVCIA
jgi:NADH:ubiquinone oxidoreductase subunit F (NADH-binding)